MLGGIDRAWEIVRRADYPSIGLIVDSFHTLGRKINPDSIRRIPGDKIFFVQLADAPQIDMDLLYWSRHFRNIPGEGDLPVTDFMRAVMANRPRFKRCLPRLALRMWADISAKP